MRRSNEVIKAGSLPGSNKYEGEETLYAGEVYAEEMLYNEGEGDSAPSSPAPNQGGPPMPAQQQIDTSKILGQVEAFLLPQMDFYSRWSAAKQRVRQVILSSSSSSSSSSLQDDLDVTGLCPIARLDDILYQVALADHIRTMQTMYRDPHDEHRLIGDLRTDHPHTTLPSKQLILKIIEGRVRCQALCRLTYGQGSVEMLRATVDLASAYALQGQWPQVAEHMAIASQKLVEV